MDVGGNIKTLNYWTHPDISEFINQRIVLILHEEETILTGVLKTISFKVKHRRETAYVSWIDIQTFDDSMISVSIHPESENSLQLELSSSTIQNYDQWLLTNIEEL